MAVAYTLPSKPQITTHYFREVDNNALAKAVFRLRKRVLIDLHGWHLECRDELERDEFDNPNTIYCAIFRAGKLIGSFRAIRSDHPYLALVKFAELATDRPYVRSALSWEVSRLVVAPDQQRFETSLLVYAAMFHLLRLKGGRSVVGFCDVAHQRLLERIGIETRPYGQAVEIGVSTKGLPIFVIAGEMPLPEHPSLRFQKLMSLVDRMEIHDATAFLGHPSLSA